MGRKPSTGAASGEDPLRALCDKLRSKGGVEWRSAVLQDERVEYFRGKDLAAYLKDKPDSMAAFVSGNKTREEQVQELVQLLLRRQLLLRCDRLFKKPKPGKKRLAKWPRKLVRHPPMEQVWAEESFYAWLYDRPTSPWQYVWSLLMVVGVFAVCCFQLAPYWVRLGVFYLSATMLVIIIGTVLLRGLLALATWLFMGRALWVWPNLMDETVGIVDAFRPLYSYDREGDAGHWAARLGVAASVGSLVAVLYSFAPEKARIADGARNAHDALLDWLLAQPNYQSISDGKNNATANATTTPGAGPASASAAGGEAGAAAEGAAAGKGAAAADAEGGEDGDKDGGEDKKAAKDLPSLDELLAELGEVDEDDDGSDASGGAAAGAAAGGADEL